MDTIQVISSKEKDQFNQVNVLSHLFKLICFCSLFFSWSYAQAANTYTPSLINIVRTNLVSGGADVGSVAATCTGAMSAASALWSPTYPFVSVKTCTLQTAVNNGGGTNQYFDIYANYNTSNGSVYFNALVGKQYQQCNGSDTRTGTIPNQICTAAACTLPQVWNSQTNSCTANPCVSGDVYSSGYYDGGTNPAAAFPHIACGGGCSIAFNGVWPNSQSKQADAMHYYASGSFVKDGFQCSGGSTSPTPLTVVPLDTTAQAAAAQAAIDKAAADARVAAKAAADATANQAAKDAAYAAASDLAIKKAAADKAVIDAKAAADKAAAVNSDPNSTQSQKDAATAASNAAASDAASKGGTAAAAAGTAASTAKPDAPPSPPDFCDLHPSSFICKNSNVNAGYCSNGVLSGFTCTSDAALCASALSEAQSVCLLSSTDGNLTTEYNKLSTGTTDNPADVGNRSSVTLPTKLTVSNEGFAATCPDDAHFSLTGHDFVIPISRYCPYLTALGYIFLSLAYISAAKIIGGSV